MGCSVSKPHDDVDAGLRLEWQDLFETLGITKSDLEDDAFERQMVVVLSRSS